MKKYLSTLLLVLLISVLVTGAVMAEDIIPDPEGDFFPLDEQITLKVLIKKNAEVSADYNVMPMILELEEKTNINLEFEAVPQNVWAEKVNLKFATASLPDLIVGNLDGSLVAQYGEYGAIAAMDGLIKEHAPNITAYFEKYPVRKAYNTSTDGHIYSLNQYKPDPAAQVQEKLWINKSWLDKLGLEVPTTIDEFYNVLKAFKEQDPNGNGKADEIPFTFMAGGSSWARNLCSFYGSWGVTDDQYGHVMVKDDKVLFSPSLDGYKEGIKYLHKLYNDGLIDMEVFTHDKSQYRAKGKGAVQIVGAYFENGVHSMVGDDWENYTFVPPLKGPEGDPIWIDKGVGMDYNTWTITEENKHKVATIKLMDYLASSDFMMHVMSYGPEGKAWTMYEDGTWEMNQDVDGMSVVEYFNNNSLGGWSVRLVSDEWFNNKRLSGKEALITEAAKTYKKHFNGYTYPPVTLDPEQLTEMKELQTVIFDYVDQMEAKWILNGGVEEDWEGYLTKLKNMNVDRLMELRQISYDAVMGTK